MTMPNTATPSADTGLPDARCAKGLPREKGSQFTVRMIVQTDVIGGSYLDTKYAQELLEVDIFAEPEDGCLVVTIFKDGTPFMRRWRSTGKDEAGRFVPRGSDAECIELGFVKASRAELRPDRADGFLKLIGRVLGPDREFPRNRPATYDRVGAGFVEEATA